MKRSEINKAIRELEAMCKKYNCYLPPFCDFTPEQWQTKGHEYDEVRECIHPLQTLCGISYRTTFQCISFH